HPADFKPAAGAKQGGAAPVDETTRQGHSKVSPWGPGRPRPPARITNLGTAPRATRPGFVSQHRPAGPTAARPGWLRFAAEDRGGRLTRLASFRHRAEAPKPTPLLASFRQRVEARGATRRLASFRHRAGRGPDHGWVRFATAPRNQRPRGGWLR